MTPIEEYWENYAIKIEDDMTFDTLFTNINWPMLYCVVASWIICYFCVWKGIGWTGKVVMFTATFPVLMLLILLVRGLTLPGSAKGVAFYLIPKWDDLLKLKETKIWIDAATQVLFSYRRIEILKCQLYDRFYFIVKLKCACMLYAKEPSRV